MVPNESTDLLSIARTVNEVSKKAVDINVINSGDGKEYTGSSKKFNNFFPDTEFTPLSESIKMLYKYYETNQHLLDVDALNEDKFLRYAKTIN